MEHLQILERKVEKMLAGNEEQMKHVASPSDKDGIEWLDKEVEWKDDIWKKVVVVMAVIEAEIGIEEGNVETIYIDDDVTLDMHLKRQKKPGVLL
ncbi:Hypothetical predicted protein [Olea europaea subsp. europaea]|uniref:Uncharacterized protein n=1 Tax=Olea europaea subsp. europaea TaxID=158383 RepID=A0A8S0UZ59_OLEEU|nr:Hypothetical predicted protein [Olea europaea subsp. europaea]